MNQESTEAVLELCLQTQHENTKKAIVLQIFRQYPLHVTNENLFKEMFDLAKWIDELKLEDTQCAETD